MSRRFYAFMLFLFFLGSNPCCPTIICIICFFNSESHVLAMAWVYNIILTTYSDFVGTCSPWN